MEGDPAKGVAVTLESRQKLVRPAPLPVDFTDGSHQDRRIPVEAWMKTATPQLRLDTTKAVSRLAIDPDAKLPDAERGNNAYAMP